MKKILLINGHPDPKSFCHALADYYEAGAKESGFEVQRLDLHSLTFDPVLHHSYRQRTPLEPDLEKAQELITWAQHVVWVFPVWWGSIPALLKGFLDRVLLPGFAYKFHENNHFWDKLLKGRSARILSTLDTPVWYYFLVYAAPAHRMMKRTVLGFCGFSPVKSSYFTVVKNATEQKRKQWLDEAKALGKAGK